MELTFIFHLAARLRDKVCILWSSRASSKVGLLSGKQKIEYHNKVLTKLFGGNSRYGCYFLAVVIFGIGIVRDTL